MRLPLAKAALFALPVACVLVAVVALPATARKPAHILRPNPADDPALIGKRMDPNRYDGSGRCVKRNPKGMRALIRWMKRNTRRNTPHGTIRCDGGVHSTGRALDWMLDARKRRQKAAAMTVINTWLAEDKRGRKNALARRMGIQLIIYNCRWWQAGDRGWSPYSACSGNNPDPTQGHIDHIHIELTKPAARLRTSFWATKGGGDSGDAGESGGVSPG